MIRAAVIGWPIAHSRSPLIHGHWLKEFAIVGSYTRIPVTPEDAPRFLRRLPDEGLVGCNVTLPHKEVAASACGNLEPVAARLGAANTLWLEDGRLCGTNTDVEGFLANLDHGAPRWDVTPGLALVLGAGGASRAVVDGLVTRGFDVVILNRTLSRADDLAARYPKTARSGLISEANRWAPSARLIVNTTSLGMKGEGDIDLDFAIVHPDTLVTDIVYVPLVTPFLARAAAHGLKTVDGLGMLLYQAVPGFERWFGRRPAVTPALRALIEADL